jgi:hypothetical protein
MSWSASTRCWTALALRLAFQKLDVRSRTERAEKIRVTTDANGGR